MTARERIRQFVTETFFVDSFGDDESFLTSGIIDSTGVLELVMFLEEKFKVKVADEEMLPENLDSVKAISAFVAHKLGTRTAA